MGSSSESLNMKAMIPPPSWLQLPWLLQKQGSPVLSASMRCTNWDGWSRWERSQSMTTLRPTTAQPLERTRAGVRRPSQDTMLACCSPLLSTTLWMEAYIEDPIMVAEYVVYLEQNYCISGGHHDLDKC